MDSTSDVPTVEGVPDRYQIVRQCGWGGQGRSFEALDRESGRAVIVEVMHVLPDQVDAQTKVAEQFVGLLHPSLVPVLHVGRHKDTVFFVIGSVSQAVTLDEVLKGGPHDARESALWITQIADAVQYLDSNGFIYRDLKPSAIMIGHDGSARLTDLATCCVAKGSPRPSGLFGTPAYMPPELVRLEGNLDVRSTIYSLGVVLYEMLTGVRDFSGSKAADILDHVLNVLPRALRSIRRSIPKELEAICLKAMAKKPEARYATADELARELRQFLSAQPERRRSFWKRK
jgi:serine/threonine protein kinase